jgi:hypothetical protein
MLCPCHTCRPLEALLTKCSSIDKSRVVKLFGTIRPNPWLIYTKTMNLTSVRGLKVKIIGCMRKTVNQIMISFGNTLIWLIIIPLILWNFSNRRKIKSNRYKQTWNKKFFCPLTYGIQISWQILRKIVGSMTIRIWIKLILTIKVYPRKLPWQILTIRFYSPHS